MSDLPKFLPGSAKELVEDSGKKINVVFRRMVDKHAGNTARAKAEFIRRMMERESAVIRNGEFLGAKIGVGSKLVETPVHFVLAYNPFTNKFWYVSTRRKSDNISEDEPSEKNIGKG